MCMTGMTAERFGRARGEAASVIGRVVSRPERSHRLLGEPLRAAPLRHAGTLDRAVAVPGPDLGPVVTYRVRVLAQVDDAVRRSGR